MTGDVAALGAALARWLMAGVLDGTVFAAAAWLASVTLLRHSSGRVLALLWLSVLVEFVLFRPVQMHAVPQLGVPGPGIESRGYLALAVAYGAVVSFLLSRLLVRQWRLRGRIRSFSLAEPAVLAQVRAAARRLSLVALPEVRVTDAPISPFTLGPLRPTLVLPRWLCEPGARFDAVLLHELAHLARRDHVLIWFERTVAISFFFWPPIHWVCRRLDEARELACDERAIREGAIPVVEYGQHLLAVVMLARERLAVGGALSIGRSAWRLERRIERLLQEAWSRRSCWLEAAAVGLLAVCSLMGLRPAPALPIAPELPSTLMQAVGEPASDANVAGPLMSTDELAEPDCVRQSCGTQCVP
jgi:BlaR1 peptidase M56